MMQITYSDGKRERHEDMTVEEFADALHRIANLADEVVSVQAVREVGYKSSGPYPNNRQGRRRWERELRAKK